MLKAEVIGNLGADAVIKEINGNSYVSFSVAHNERQKNAQGERLEKTIWVDVLWWGSGGGLLPYLSKGTRVFVRGDLKASAYTDKSGQVQSQVSMFANEVQFCGGIGSATQGTTTNASPEGNQPA